MATGSKRSSATKQRRRASMIEGSGKSRGMSTSRSKQMAYATVSNEEGGGKKIGGGRGKKVSRATSARGARKGGRKTARRGTKR